MTDYTYTKISDLPLLENELSNSDTFVATIQGETLRVSPSSIKDYIVNSQGIQSIQGLQGPQGLQGRQGLQGLQGEIGTQGIQGTQGIHGVQGFQGMQGLQGLQGVQGTQGPPSITTLDQLTDVDTTTNEPAIAETLVLNDSNVFVPKRLGLRASIAQGEIVGDEHFNNVSLLLHMDGSDGSATFTDSSQNNFTVTRYGNAEISTAQSKFGGASGYFNGTDAYLGIPFSSLFEFGTGDLTIETWAYFSSFTAPQNIWSQRNSNVSSSTGITLRVGTNRKLVFFWGAGYGGVEGATTLSADTWYHVALTRQGNYFKLWVNGNNDGVSPEITQSMSFGIAPNIGRAVWNSEYMKGHLDDFRVTKGVARYTANFTPPTGPFPNYATIPAANVPLFSDVDTITTPPAIAETLVLSDEGIFVPKRLGLGASMAQGLIVGDPHFNNVSLLLHMDGSNDSTVFADATGRPVLNYGNARISTSQSKFGGASGYFDGNGDYLAVANAPAFDFGSQDFTIEAWVYLTGGTGERVICSKWNLTGNNLSYSITANSDQYLTFYYSLNGSLGVFSEHTPGFTIPLNTWTHVCVCRSGNTLRLFIDGVSRHTNSSFTADIYSSSAPFTVGSGNNEGFWNGYIDELRITKGVARYLENFTPPTGPFLDYATAPATNVPLLSDVDTITTPPTLGQGLVWNGSKWIPGTPSGASSYTVATLPAANIVGAGSRAFVTDANATTFLSIVVGGGINKVPVVSDGTNWLIG